VKNVFPHLNVNLRIDIVKKVNVNSHKINVNYGEAKLFPHLCLQIAQTYVLLSLNT